MSTLTAALVSVVRCEAARLGARRISVVNASCPLGLERRSWAGMHRTADVCYGQNALPALFTCAAALLRRGPHAAMLLGYVSRAAIIDRCPRYHDRH